MWGRGLGIVCCGRSLTWFCKINGGKCVVRMGMESDFEIAPLQRYWSRHLVLVPWIRAPIQVPHGLQNRYIKPTY